MTTENTQDPWLLLDAELDAWQADAQCASLWWRDDDAVAASPSLDRLLRVCANTGLLLAVVPAPLQPSLTEAVVQAIEEKGPFVRVAQHGYAHINHAPRGRGLGAWELGLHRSESAVLADLEAGWHVLEEAFGKNFLPVLVPPWNHVAEELHEAIAAQGYRALSTEGPRTARELVPGLLSVNGHCDPIRWKGGARFAGETKTLASLVEHLKQRREGRVDSTEPTGFVTHHLDLDDAGWAFSEKLASRITAHPGASWVQPDELFGEQA